MLSIAVCSLYCNCTEIWSHFFIGLYFKTHYFFSQELEMTNVFELLLIVVSWLIIMLYIAAWQFFPVSIGLYWIWNSHIWIWQGFSLFGYGLSDSLFGVLSRCGRYQTNRTTILERTIGAVSQTQIFCHPDLTWWFS